MSLVLSAAACVGATDHIDRDDERLVEQIHRRLLPARGIWAGHDEILLTGDA